MIPRHLDAKDIQISQIKPYKTNPKIHPQSQIDLVKQSLLDFGWTQPLCVDKEYTLIIGHCRVEAAKQLGEDTVPVVYREDLTDAQAKALRILDNKSNESAWDTDLLQVELAELQAFDIDIKDVGFDNLPDRWDVDEAGFPTLPSGDRAPFQQMTFTLSDDQAEEVKKALEKAKDMGYFIDTGNDNSNGNALARIAETFNGIS